QKVGIMDDMDEDFKLLYSDDKEQIKNTLDAMDSQTPLIVYDEENGYRLAEYDLTLMSGENININYISLQGISSQSTLADAFDILKDKRSGALYVYNLLDDQQIMGLLRWDQINNILTIRNSLL
ncbi:MAG: chloride channel protein, partial [Pseudoalteromonas sp.]|nr:chloride channel protein [Pseudoalteromonas sp.]